MDDSVSIVTCESYDEQKVLNGLCRSIDLIGGIERYVKRGDRVLLKPNLIFGKDPGRAVTTHPAIIKGVIQLVRSAGGTPMIGDSPGMESLKRAAEKAGIRKVADELDCPLVEFNHPVLPVGRREGFFRHVEIDRAVLNADVLINLPKWKTHAQMLLTLGVKNLFGCVPGRRKALWHLQAGENHQLFARMLLDVYRLTRPSLTILDGVWGMEGNGPGSGDPIPLRLILASNDALALDQVVCDLLGISRRSLPTNRVALEQGLRKNGIDIVGERVEDVRIPAFKLPRLSGADWNLPPFLKRVLKNALSAKPVISTKVCKACHGCEEICPPKAIRTKDKRLVFDYKTCIRCFCCQEICPEGAIIIQPGWASRLVGRPAKGGKGVGCRV